jgi:HAE1 family hydrophobic/amphiphilic exporter-1
MDLIRWSMNRPVSVAVGVLLIVMFGLIGFGAIPIQLTPTVDRPIITVNTSWPGRSPQEIVDEITKEQEERLKNVKNLKTMRSVSQEGNASITLEFYIGSDITRALQEVSDALRQVSDYPDEVDEPIIQSSEGTVDQAIAWVIIDLDPAKSASHPGYDVSTLFTAMDREVKPFLERIDGVAQVNIYGGREKEVRVLLDPTRLALRGISHRQVIDALRAENANVSAGTIAEGKRDYRVRVTGQYASPDEVLDTIVAYRAPADNPEGLAVPVFVRDVGAVEIGYEKERSFVRSMGSPCLAMNVIRQSGANVMTVMAAVRERLEEVRAEFLPRLDPAAGPDLRMRQVYDETRYIQSAINLVLNNLWIGGSLAVLVLLVFLRSIKSVAVIALAIPISIIGTFLVMLAFGRTLNVVSLAGLAFATGMVVDNAIVVLENIDRRRSLGDSPSLAVYRGAKEVWGAILASTLTTVAVFIPVLTIQEEAGQIFFDLTLAMAVSVSLSLVVAITVVPAATALLFRASPTLRHGHGLRDLFGLAPFFKSIATRLGDLVHWAMTGWRAWSIRPLLIIAFTGASLLGARTLAPPLDYLPAGNRNLVFGGLLIPPGLSIDQMREYSRDIEAQVEPYIEKDTAKPDVRAALAPIFRFDAPETPFEPVGIENFFIGSFSGGMFVGGTSMEEQTVIPIGSLITGVMNTIPDAFGFAAQASVFGRFGSGNSIDIEVSGPRLDRVTAAANVVLDGARQRYGFGARASPANFNLSQPEWRVRLTDAGRELGLRTRDVGTAVRGLFDGAFAGDYILDGRKVDLMVLPFGRAGEGRLDYKEQLASIPVVTPAGRVVPIDSVVEFEPALAPQEINRIEELPSVTVQVTPPKGKAIEEVMEEIRAEIIEPARHAGLIDPSMRARLEGTAAKLDEVKTALFGTRAPGGDVGRLWWQRGVEWLSFLLVALAAAAAISALVKSARPTADAPRRIFAYGFVGAILLGLTLGGLLFLVAREPQLITARFVWALLVTYLLMAALFESFLYPFVIMFSVPLAVVGGFASLRVVHEWTLATPTIAPQQLDVLTMIGFVILIGTVVNNAILLVEQALHFMHPERIAGFEEQPPLAPLDAIAQSVRTRVRPIFMTTLTTLGGGLPLVIAPGAGSEMYRGLGAVVIGGLFVSTIFTLVLVPLLLSLVLQMREGVIVTLLGGRAASAPDGPPTDDGAPSGAAAKPARRRELALEHA